MGRETRQISSYSRRSSVPGRPRVQVSGHQRTVRTSGRGRQAGSQSMSDLQKSLEKLSEEIDMLEQKIEDDKDDVKKACEVDIAQPKKDLEFEQEDVKKAEQVLRKEKTEMKKAKQELRKYENECKKTKSQEKKDTQKLSKTKKDVEKIKRSLQQKK